MDTLDLIAIVSVHSQNNDLHVQILAGSSDKHISKKVRQLIYIGKCRADHVTFHLGPHLSGLVVECVPCLWKLWAHILAGA